jgi:mRNA interferase MazF
VVVQADELLPLDTVIVAPTSTSGPPFTFRPVIAVRDQPTYVLVDQIAAAAVERLGTSVGRLSATELRAVDEALTVVLGL